MKVINTPATVPYIANSFKSQKLTIKDDTLSQVSSDTVVKKDTPVNKINIMQKENIQSQQMFGALTQLSEALELFRQQPNAYEQNIKEILTEVQKNSPQLSKHIQNSLNNPDQMISDVNNMRQKLSQKIASDKKEIASYLVAEQNRDAAQKKTIGLQNISNISKQMTSTTANELYTARLEQVAKLLF
ncbi:MAG: hypothetical protein ACRC0X_05865 [Brevinema sp.]